MSATDLHLENSPAANGLGSPTCYGHELDYASTRAGNPAGVRSVGQRLTHLDLFSGIGGFALAARWADIDTIGFSEIEPYACRVLAKNFPNIPNHGDITKLTGVRADIITGGFPCQPFSVAGLRKGADDDRHLWPEMLRVIEEAQPTWVVGENVPGIGNMELDNVLSDLGRIGYTGWPLEIPACAVDGCFIGNRVWIVAAPSGAGLPAGWEVSFSTKPVQPMLACGSMHRRVATPWERQYEWEKPRLVERPMARATDGLPARLVRLGSAGAIRAFGNSIVPQVAFVILDAIAAIEFAEQVAGVGALADLGGAAELRNAPARNTQALPHGGAERTPNENRD